jgi:hypothetical protein
MFRLVRLFSRSRRALLPLLVVLCLLGALLLAATAMASTHFYV